jgi:hypothetical protein
MLRWIPLECVFLHQNYLAIILCHSHAALVHGKLDYLFGHDLYNVFLKCFNFEKAQIEQMQPYTTLYKEINLLNWFI